MTKQHFIAIAAEFKDRLNMARAKDAEHLTQDMCQRAVEGVIHGFCNVAETFNPRFDRKRFLAACGL